MKNGAFTLIELLVVIAIIGVLSSVVLTSIVKSREQARAARILSDMREIKKAWLMWQTDTDASFPRETIYPGNTQWPCHDEPAISSTELAQNTLGLANWNGPYLNSASWPTDAFGKVYGYDNDNDTYVPNTRPYGGVNVFLGWCSDEANKLQYLQMAQLLDKMVDGGDGWHAGTVRWDWDGSYGQMSYLISERY